MVLVLVKKYPEINDDSLKFRIPNVRSNTIGSQMVCVAGARDSYSKSIVNDKPFSWDPDFLYDDRYDDASKVYQYLCESRKIEKELVDRMIAEHKLYQDDRNNCVFVGYDKNNNPRYALRVGTNPKYKFKGEVKGSDKAFAPSPRYHPKSKSVAVFESVIDALSYESMNSAEGLNTIALSGISSLGLDQYLKENPQTTSIILMLDNDEIGINASKVLASKYSEKGYNVMIHLPRKHKDWNEELVANANGERECFRADKSE
ncbi:MAG: hypothetical protein CSA15_06660 [Candidatus Delongbacteria bacterium]|nr:MAG: hypothetical protein CSA15_06660 [Candidatus Delongbacteria bacterium]